MGEEHIRTIVREEIVRAFGILKDSAQSQISYDSDIIEDKAVSVLSYSLDRSIEGVKAVE